MLDSVRARLTFWYTLVLAFVLIFSAVLTYLLYGHSISRRANSDLTQLAEAFATTFNAELAGGATVKDAARESILEHRFRSTFFVLIDDSGSLLDSSLDLAATDGFMPPPAKEIPSSDAFRSLADSSKGKLDTIHGVRGGFRELAKPLSARGKAYTLLALQSLRPQKEMMQDIRNTFLWAIPAALALASLGGYFLARKSLAPIAAMAAEAGSMGAANLNRRLPVANERDELGRLALTFNQLLERLEVSFEQQRRFMADASHELRTPVAILRGESEVTLSQPERSPDEYRQALAILHQESERLSHIIEDLFTLARADAGQYPVAFREVYLDELASEALVRARSLALSKNIALTPAIEPDLPVCAHETLLGRMLLNLLDNAIKYSPPGSAVTLACRREGTNYLVSVSDNGSGIPAELQSRIFERFFRGDKARSRSDGEIGGAGLGLSIARWIAEAHHGQLVLTRSDSSGSLFTATLPRPKE
jgi:two-component system, OmpR family, sensor kinase